MSHPLPRNVLWALGLGVRAWPGESEGWCCFRTQFRWGLAPESVHCIWFPCWFPFLPNHLLSPISRPVLLWSTYKQTPVTQVRNGKGPTSLNSLVRRRLTLWYFFAHTGKNKKHFTETSLAGTLMAEWQHVPPKQWCLLPSVLSECGPPERSRG